MNTIVTLGLEAEDKDKEQLVCTIASKTIAKGAYAEVKKATIKGADDPVKALKVMKRSSFDQWFHNEFNNQRKVLELKDARKHIVGLENDYHFKFKNMDKTNEGDQIAVMEFMKGGDLLGLLENQPDSRFTEHRSKMYFKQMVASIRCCHDAGIVHLDLKPENFLLSGNKQVLKLTDFGESQYCTPGGTIPPTQNGTRTYKAPEIVEGRRVGPSADIWSLGVTLYLMLHGNFPFDSDDKDDLARKISSADFEFEELSTGKLVSPLARELVERMLTKSTDAGHRINVDEIPNHEWCKIQVTPCTIIADVVWVCSCHFC